ncbi:hypothetical protein GCM10010431_43570 [Streptomyces kunmingensis]
MAETPLSQTDGAPQGFTAGLPGGDPRPSLPEWLSDGEEWTERARSWCIPGARTRGFVTHG